jgi:hypothetical protein
MTSDLPINDTRADVPEGRYERKKQQDLAKDQIPPQTDERLSNARRGHAVRIDTGSLRNVGSVRVALDMTLQNRKDVMASLNERLRRLRAR